MFLSKKVFFIFAAVCLSVFPVAAFAHQPRIIYSQTGDITIQDPEISQAFYDELKGSPRNYFISADKPFNLYINLLAPLQENKNGRYDATVYLVDETGRETPVLTTQISSVAWSEYYEEFGRDYYMKGPEIEKQVPAGKYKIQVFSADPPSGEAGNLGKYVLAVGKTESFDLKSLLNIYWQLPLLKIQFFKSDPLQFFLTPFGIGGIGAAGGLLILLAIFYWLAGVIKVAIQHSQAKTLLLTSGGMPQMKDEIIGLLQKPAYDITVAFISTASKPEEDKQYVQNDWIIMHDDLGFNVEEIDIDGKTEAQVMKLLELKDIIFVEGGNTFYLLNAMKKCNFEKIIRKLLKLGKVYIGVSAGSIVAGKDIKTAEWLGDKNIVNLKNLKGLNLVPFNIFVHYQPGDEEIIRQQIKSPRKRKKHLRILTDDQAILVQGREAMFIGEGDQIIV